jgi:hypothetical protein
MQLSKPSLYSPLAFSESAREIRLCNILPGHYGVSKLNQAYIHFLGPPRNAYSGALGPSLTDVMIPESHLLQYLASPA